MGWRETKNHTKREMTREEALNVLARVVQRKNIRPAVDQAIRTLVRLLVEAENKSDSQERLDALIELARKRGDVEYLVYGKKENPGS
jgi:hypothetical protein